MAQKRMFDRAIIETDNFMDLSMSAKALYFLMGMDADDEGFVSPRKVIRVHGGNEDDIKILIAKNFVIPFKSGVVVITDWNNNNWLDSRRIKPTKYQDEKSLLALTKDNTYVLSDSLALVKPEESRVVENRGEIYVQIENPKDKKERTNLEGFETFMSLYPKKKNKAQASAEWRKLSQEERSLALKDVPLRCDSKDWKSDNGKFVPMPANYLRDHRWEDEIKKVKSYISFA